MGFRVLLVEDNSGDAALIRSLLSDTTGERFEIDVVARLGDAERMISQGHYDAVLLDLGLPDSWGMDTLTEALEFAGDIPIVVLTGSKSEGMGNEAVRIGAQDYLVKGDANADTIERSITYSIERRKAQLEIQMALQSYADLVREIPSGLLTFQFENPSSLRLLSYNPRAEQVLGRSLIDDLGKDIAELPPFSRLFKPLLLEVTRTGVAEVLKGKVFQVDGQDVAIDLRAFSIPGRRLCLSLDDVTDRVREEELRRKAYSQIERNIEHFASLVDEIRNPNSVIIGLAERMSGDASRCIMLQAERIENIVNRLDEEWMASETIRVFLRKSIR